MEETIVSINVENTITVGLMIVLVFLILSFVAQKISRHNNGG